MFKTPTTAHTRRRRETCQFHISDAMRIASATNRSTADRAEVDERPMIHFSLLSINIHIFGFGPFLSQNLTFRLDTHYFECLPYISHIIFSFHARKIKYERKLIFHLVYLPISLSSSFYTLPNDFE